jgi:hypothetical protein
MLRGRVELVEEIPAADLHEQASEWMRRVSGSTHKNA